MNMKCNDVNCINVGGNHAPYDCVIGEEIKYQDDDGVIHGCHGSVIIPTEHPSRTKLVWTFCGIDVPANNGFLSPEKINCRKCLNDIKESKED